MNNLIRAALGMSLVATSALLAAPALASDHRESPAIQGDPMCDLADVYAFLDPHDSSKLVLVMTVNPFEVTVQEGEYPFPTSARYRFNIDTTGNAVANYQVEVSFDAYNMAMYSQNFTAKFTGGVTVSGPVTQGTRLFPVPNEPIITQASNGASIFVGPRDDPFFIDTVGAFRTFAGTGHFTGTDALAGYNVEAIAVELPLSQVLKKGSTLGIWADVARRDTFYHGFQNPQGIVSSAGPYHQIQRLGNPGVKVLFIPPQMLDQYNATRPSDNPDMWKSVIESSFEQPRYVGFTPEQIEQWSSTFAPDTLKLDVSQPVKFPNGRWLGDDAIDLIFADILWDGNPIFYAPGVLDGVNNNDVPFLDSFPFLAPPHQAP